MKNSFPLGIRQTMRAFAVAGITVLLSCAAVSAQSPDATSPKPLQYSLSWTKDRSNPALTKFESWADSYAKSGNASMVSEGVALARQRSAALVELIKTNPEKALASAVPAAIRQQLPAEVLAELEQRVSGIGDLSVLIYCPTKDGNHTEKSIERTVHLDGRTYAAYAYGRRATQGSKKGIPLHGIVVNGVMAVHEKAVREMDEDETVPVGARLIEVTDPAPSATGSPLIAEVGGRFYRFASLDHLRRAEAALEQAESGVSPYPNSSVESVLEAPAGASVNSPNPTTAWTTGLKKILVIRVDFSDLQGDPGFPGGPAGTAAYMQNLMDTDVSTYYAKSSYGLTSLTNVVTTQLYRMPQTAETYATAGDNTGLHNDAETLAAADYTLADYDRIIVVFSFLGSLPGSLIDYGGLAEVSGPSVWVNGEFDFRVVSHELGHTYGLYHAGLWQVLDGNPLSDNGVTIEYGDDFDTMGANFADDRSTDFSPYFKNILGWVADSQVMAITTNGVYRVYTFDHANFVDAPSNPTLALKLRRDDSKTYWFGIRRNFTSNNYMQNGVYAIWGLNSVGGGGGGGFLSQLLDLNTPGTSPQAGVNGDYDAALQFSQILSDPPVNLLLTPISEGGVPPNTYVDIQIGAGGAPDFRIATNAVVGGNGNGIIDANECNSLFIVLTNFGLGGATNIEAILTSTNEGVIITTRSALYEDLPAGGGGVNLTPFKISTAPSFRCGTRLNFDLQIKSDEKTVTRSFSLSSGTGGAPIQYSSAVAVPIPDLGTAISPVTVAGFPSAIFNAAVSLHITHTWDSDLVIELISPDGVTNRLAANVGGASDNFGVGCGDGNRTVFDDSAATRIALGQPPFVGAFRPDRPLSVYIGKFGTNVNGTWKLRVRDQVGGDVGTLQCWSLILTPAVCTDGGGECPGSDLAIGGSSAPEPAVTGNDFTYTLNITNRGPKTATGVSLTQILPPNVLYQNATITKGTISGSQGSPNVSGNIGTLAAGEVVTASVTVKAIQLGTITSSATVAGVSDPDPDLANNSVNISSHINPPTADMAIGMVASANPVLMGGTLIYTISVTNNGPSAASGVIVSNTLPGAVSLVSASPSQGSTTIAGNVVIFNFGSLNIGAVATATVGVIPLAQGQITASARVSANQFDPISANSVATVNTSVSPAADLAVGIDNVPAAIVLGQNLTYMIRATNNGPSVASGVLISQEIPTNGTLISATSDAGVISMSENVISCDLTGTNLPMNATVTMTVVVGFASTSTNHTSVSIVGALADPNPANNQVSATTIVAPPFVAIEPLSAVLTSESLPPPNGSVESGETVTVQLRVRNGGNIATTNLMAKLLATGGVTSPTTATRLYGAIPPGGFSSAQPFTFTASGASGGMVTATLQLSGDATNTVSFTFALQGGASFANTNLIVIYDGFSNTNVAASPYPSSIMVSGITGLVGRVTATLSNLNHAFPHDVSILLVAPSGASTLLMSHAADVSSASGVNITFDDLALQAVPEMGSISSGSWRPAAYGAEPVFPVTVPPATNVPVGPYTASMSSFNGLNPNGVWSLFVMDDNAGDGGAISNGWSLVITTITPINTVADIAVSGSSLPNPVLLGGLVTNIFTIVNNGTNQATGVVFTNVLSPNLALVSTDVSAEGAIVSTSGGKVVANFASLDAGANATVTVVMSPAAGGVFYSTGIVAAVETDLSPANNIVAVATTVNVPIADVAIRNAGSPNPVVLGSNLVYTITVTNSGPQNALNVVVTNPIPSGLLFLSSSVGTFASGTLTGNLGTISPGASVVISVTNRAVALGTITNSASVRTASSDTNSANNSTMTTTVIRSPAVKLVAAGAKLISESLSPKDGTVDPGETVTVSLSLANIGELNTANLNATLLSSGGVTAPSGGVGYGAIIHGGAAVTRNFTFTASPSASGNITATLQLTDGASNLGTVDFVFGLPQTALFVNTNAIVIPDHGPAAPYPSAITVSGLTGVVSKVTVNLNGFAHSFPHDVGVMLVGPSGGKAMVMSGVGGSHIVTNVNLTFDDGAASTLTELGQLVTGTFLPTVNESGKSFPSPASAAGSASSFIQVRGTDPNGTWLLYVVDDATGDAGVISAGWGLSITAVNPVTPVADLAISLVDLSPAPAYTGLPLTYTFLVANNGPAVATGVTVSNTFPSGITVVSNVGTLNMGSSVLVPFSFTPSTAGITTNSAVVALNETDLHTVDNSAAASVIVLNLLRPRLSGLVTSNGFQLTLAGQANMTYIIQSSSNLTSWTAITTNSATPGGTLLFLDTNMVGSQRFYRAIASP